MIIILVTLGSMFFFCVSVVSSVIEYFKTHVYDQAIPVASFQVFVLPDGSEVVGK